MENLLLNNLPAIVAGLGCVALVACTFYQLHRRDSKLKAFREALRTGDMVRVKNPDGFLRARIMRRNNESCYTMIIDTRQPFIAALSNIYQP